MGERDPPFATADSLPIFTRIGGRRATFSLADSTFESIGGRGDDPAFGDDEELIGSINCGFSRAARRCFSGTAHMMSQHLDCNNNVGIVISQLRNESTSNTVNMYNTSTIVRVYTYSMYVQYNHIQFIQ